MMRCEDKIHVYTTLKRSVSTPAASRRPITLETIREIKKTFFKALTKAQIEDLRAFAANPQGLSTFPTGALLFLYKVFSMHALPRKEKLIHNIFTLFRSRLDANPAKTNEPILNQSDAIAIYRFYTSTCQRKNSDPSMNFIELPEDLVDRLYKLAYPKGTIEFQLKSGKPNDTLKVMLNLINKRADDLVFMNKHDERTDPTFSLIRTMSALAADIYKIHFDNTLSIELAAITDRTPIEKAKNVLCDLIVNRFPTRIGKLHNHELFAALAVLRNTAANSAAMRLYKNWLIAALERRYDADEASALILAILNGFGTARILAQIKSPDFCDIANAACQCVIRHDILLANEQWAQITLVRMIQVCKTLGTNEAHAITMKVLGFPAVLELIRHECDTLLVIALTDLVVARGFISNSSAPIKEALMHRFQELMRPNQTIKPAPEALCAILNMAIRGDGITKHTDAWIKIRDSFLQEIDEYFHSMPQQLLTSLVIFASYDAQVKASPASTALWGKAVMIVTRRQKTNQLSLHNIAFMYDVATRELRVDRGGFRSALLVASIIRLRTFIKQCEWDQLGLNFANVPFFRLTGNRGVLLRFMLALSRVIGKNSSAFSPREMQLTVLCTQFVKRAVHRTFTPHMDNMLAKSMQSSIFDAFRYGDEKLQKLYAQDLKLNIEINYKTKVTTKNWCKYVAAYGSIMQSSSPFARCLQQCGEDKEILQLAFAKLWDDKKIFEYIASADRRKDVRDALQVLGKHWAPQLWDYIESVRR